MKFFELFAVCALTLVPSVAMAQPSAEPTPADPVAGPVPAAAPVAYMPPPPVAAAPLAEAGVLADANSGRTWLAPTALMSPKGSWAFSDWELFFIGASYALTDDVSLSAVTLIPLVADQPFVGLVTGKARLYRSPRLHVAAQASMTVLADGDASATAGTIGGVATYCTSADCASHVSGFVAAGVAYEDQTVVPLLVAASLVQRLGKRVKAVFEIDTGAVAGKVNAVADGALLWYGLRFTSANIGVDLGLAKGIYEGSSDDEILPWGYPMVSFQYRSLPSD